MLLQNNTQILFSLNIKLSFDTGVTKVGTVEAGDYLLLKFNYDGNKYKKACKIVDIQPIVLSTQPVSYSAILIVDCSGKFSAERLKVASKDILDFRIVTKEFIDSLAPDYEITDDMFDGNATPIVPKEIYKIPGVGVAGVDEARILI